MNKFLLCVLAVNWLLGCALQAPEVQPEDPILGTWKGVGMLADFQMEFKEDKTYRMFSKEFPEDSTQGTWVASNGKYAIKLSDSGQQVNRTGWIDGKGRFIMTEDEQLDTGIKFVFERADSSQKKVPPTGKVPLGEWRYAYTSKSSIPAASPAPFDTMIFSDRGRVLLKSSVAAKEFDYPCEISNDAISIIADAASAAKIELSYRWERDGEQLILSTPGAEFGGPFALEWVMLKPEGFVQDNLEGTYTVALKEEDWIQDAGFGKDGLFYRTVRNKDGRVIKPINEAFHDYYRLWTAPFGAALTIVTYVPDVSSQATEIYKYEKGETGLAMTPVELLEDGKLHLHKEAKEIWKRKPGSGAPSTTSFPENEQARLILRKAIAFQKEMKSFTYEFHSRVSLTIQGKSTEGEEDAHFAFEFPNKFRSKSVGKNTATAVTDQVYCDGTKLFVYNPASKQYRECDAPSDLTAIATAVDFKMLPGVMTEVPFALSVEEQMKSVGEVGYVGKYEIDGVACHCLRFKYETSLMSGADIWIEAGEYPLVRRLIPRLREDGIEKTVNAKVSITHASLILSQDKWTINQPIDAQIFSFTPPDGAAKVNEGEK